MWLRVIKPWCATAVYASFFARLNTTKVVVSEHGRACVTVSNQYLSRLNKQDEQQLQRRTLPLRTAIEYWKSSCTPDLCKRGVKEGLTCVACCLAGML